MESFTFDADQQLIKSDDKNVRMLLVGEEKRNPWFRGNDVANLLGYSNQKKAVVTHVSTHRISTLAELLDQGGPVLGPGGSCITQRALLNQNDLDARYVNESGLYELAIKSKVPAAIQFQDWIIDEVLPSIRKTGQYTTEENPLSYNTAEIERQYIYVAIVQEEPVKIGKYGRTARKTEERFVENRRKYTDPYFFHPLLVMEVDDAVKAEKVFSKLPEIAENKHPIKTNTGMDNETFVIPPTLTTQKLHFLMRKAAAAAMSKDLLMGHIPAEDKEVTIAKLNLETQRLEVENRRLETDHEYRMERLKRGLEDGSNDCISAKRRKVTIRDSSDESAEEEDVGEREEEVSEEGALDEKVQEFVRSVCDFGSDDRSARTVDRFRTDKVYLHQEFVKRHGKTSPSKFYEACQKLEGIELVTVCVDGKRVKAFSGIRLKERAALLSGEVMMNRYLEEKCEMGDDTYCIGKSEFYENFLLYAKQFVKEDAMTYKHGFSANAFNKFLALKDIRVSKTTWRGAWGKIYVGIRPNAGYPTVDEIIALFLEKNTEHMVGANVGRPKLLSALTKFTRHNCGTYPLRITGEMLTAHLAANGVEVVMINRNAHFANITLNEA